MTLPSYPSSISIDQIRNEFGIAYTMVERQPSAGAYYDPGTGYEWIREVVNVNYGEGPPSYYYSISIYWAGVEVYFASGGGLGNQNYVVVGSTTYYRSILDHFDDDAAGTVTYYHQVYRKTPVIYNADSNPINFDEYHAGNSTNYVPSGSVGYPSGGGATNIPSSGALSFDNFHGATRYWVLNYTLNSGQYDINLDILNEAISSGFNNSIYAPPLRAVITISGVLGSGSTSNYALRTGSAYAQTPNITIIVNSGGYITGAGGSNGVSVNDGTGGPGLLLEVATTVLNYGIIQGGGGSGQASPDRGTGFGGGSGYVGGAGSPGFNTGGAIPYSGTLDSGGSWQPDNGKAGYSNGGAGGGWVSTYDGTYGSPSTDGWGYGSPGTGANPGVYHGWSPPGTAIMGWSSYAAGGSYQGTVRGYIDTTPPIV